MAGKCDQGKCRGVGSISQFDGGRFELTFCPPLNNDELAW